MPQEIQKQFVDTHLDFFNQELDNIFEKNLDFDVLSYILDKFNGFEVIQNNTFEITFLKSDVQAKLYEKYKENIYTGTQKQFIDLVKQIKDADYQTSFIKNSPFYKELIYSNRFTELLINLKDKDFILELTKTSDAYNKLINSPIAFSNLISLMTKEEQLK